MYVCVESQSWTEEGRKNQRDSESGRNIQASTVFDLLISELFAYVIFGKKIRPI